MTRKQKLEFTWISKDTFNPSQTQNAQTSTSEGNLSQSLCASLLFLCTSLCSLLVHLRVPLFGF
jgi:hypothetical protein